MSGSERGLGQSQEGRYGAGGGALFFPACEGVDIPVRLKKENRGRPRWVSGLRDLVGCQASWEACCPFFLLFSILLPFASFFSCVKRKELEREQDRKRGFWESKRERLTQHVVFDDLKRKELG